MSDKNKKELGYRANIRYEENYLSDYVHRRSDSINDQPNAGSSNINNSIMEGIQDNVNSLIQLVPQLPTEIQTAINQVLKPVIRDWKKIKDYDYPTRIPDSDDPIIGTPPNSSPSNSSPSNTEGGNFPGNIPPWVPPQLENKEPTIIVPDITPPMPELRPEEKPIITPITPIVSDDDLFEPGSDRTITYEEIDIPEKMRMEYTKNMADLLDYYTERLKDLVCNYYLHKLNAYVSSKDSYDISFLNNEITSSTCSTSEDLRHLMDSALRHEVIGSNKLQFSLNTFSLESTLYHLKNVNAVQELRLRYAEIEKQENSALEDSTSNKILNGSRDMYDKKYDLAYINLYKYLDGSLNILEDCLNTLKAGIKSKETLIRKDGLNK